MVNRLQLGLLLTPVVVIGALALANWLRPAQQKASSPKRLDMTVRPVEWCSEGGTVIAFDNDKVVRWDGQRLSWRRSLDGRAITTIDFSRRHDVVVDNGGYRGENRELLARRVTIHELRSVRPSPWGDRLIISGTIIVDKNYNDLLVIDRRLGRMWVINTRQFEGGWWSHDTLIGGRGITLNLSTWDKKELDVPRHRRLLFAGQRDGEPLALGVDWSNSNDASNSARATEYRGLQAVRTSTIDLPPGTSTIRNASMHPSGRYWLLCLRTKSDTYRVEAVDLASGARRILLRGEAQYSRWSEAYLGVFGDRELLLLVHGKPIRGEVFELVANGRSGDVSDRPGSGWRLQRTDAATDASL